MHTTSKRKKILQTAAIVAALGALAVGGTYSAFTATTTNSGNSISSGTVKIDQHTGATTLYNVSNQKPGQQTIKCVRVTYTGSLGASVKLYEPGGNITNAWQYNLKVERGSGLTTLDNTMSCAGFSASSTAFNTTLDNFPQSYALGIDGKSGGAAWTNGQSVDYRFTIEPYDDPSDGAHTSVVSTSAHSFTWEARNN